MHSKAYNRKSLQESINRASERQSPHHIYKSLLRMRAIHDLKMNGHIFHVIFLLRLLHLHSLPKD